MKRYHGTLTRSSSEFESQVVHHFSGVGTLKESGEAVNLLMRVRFPSLTPMPA